MSNYTKEHLKAIDEAIATGALTITHQGKTTQFRSLNEMLRIRGLISKQLHDSNQKNRQSRVFTPTFDRGYQ